MAAKHTPAPWSITPTQHNHGNTTSICDQSGFEIARILSPAWDPKADFTAEESRDAANAQRIVACVAYCEGVPTELLLKDGSVKAIAEGLANALREIRDATHKNALTLRGMADIALNKWIPL